MIYTILLKGACIYGIITYREITGEYLFSA